MQLPSGLQPCFHHLFVFLLRGPASAFTAASLAAASLAASLTTSVTPAPKPSAFAATEATSCSTYLHKTSYSDSIERHRLIDQ